MSTPLSVRVSKVSGVLGIPTEKILRALDEEGISDDVAGLAVLDAPTTTVEDLVTILKKSSDTFIKPLKAKAAASILKDTGCERKSDVPEASTLTEALKVMRPIQQWTDQELLEKYNQSRDADVEMELHKRSAGRNFLVLKKGKFEPGKEEIDIDTSLGFLKKARKQAIPSFMPLADSTVCPIYSILSLNAQDRIIEICPFCGGSLFMGYCEHCMASFAGIGDDERAYLKLISATDYLRVDSLSDRKAVLTSAQKGLEDLRVTWPGMSQRFNELKLTNSLPKLRVVGSRPTTVQDPFFQDGNRVFGNRTF